MRLLNSIVIKIIFVLIILFAFYSVLSAMITMDKRFKPEFGDPRFQSQVVAVSPSVQKIYDADSLIIKIYKADSLITRIYR